MQQYNATRLKAECATPGCRFTPQPARNYCASCNSQRLSSARGGGEPQRAQPPANPKPASAPRPAGVVPMPKKRVGQAVDVGPRPEMAYLQVSAMRPGAEYQRSLNRAHARKIRTNFRLTWCAPLTVTPGPDGSFIIIDGQHRWHAACELGVVLLPCYIISESTLVEQASCFVAQNVGRLAVSKLTIFHAKCLAGDAEATGIVQACSEAGVSIPRGHRKANECKPNETAAIGVLAEIFKTPGDGPAHLVKTLRAIVTAYPEKTGQLSSLMIRSVWLALYREQCSAAAVLCALKTTSDADLKLEASFAVAADNSVKVKDAYFNALLALVRKAAQ